MNKILVKSLSNICILVTSGFIIVDLIHIYMISWYYKHTILYYSL